MTSREMGSIIAGDELFRDAPGYDPLDLSGDAPLLKAPPLQYLVKTRQEDWRGGHVEVIQFVTPAPDVAMHFSQPVRRSSAKRYGVASLLRMSSFAAAVIYHDTPATFPRSGIYFNLPPVRDRQEVELGIGSLLIGQPSMDTSNKPADYEMSDMVDEHSADAQRVVGTLEQLAEVIDRFGWGLGLEEADRRVFTEAIIANTKSSGLGAHS